MLAFDPEKVERFYNVETDGILQGDMVAAFDYDQLLELYRAFLISCPENGQ